MILEIAAQEFVLIEDAVMRTIAPYARPPENQREAGGILIGSYRGPHVEIVDCTVPLPADRRLRFLFDRKDRGHQAAALAAWRGNDERVTAVGEWHTHPEPFPTPSMLDRMTWSRQMKTASHPLIFLIVGYEGFWCGFGWRGVVERMLAADP
ncbi:Mov34/MPN/PAD-1 family protein [Tabrizicola sp.]|uniref:Mov34/MPN/PAD-1 family protein n=1 Tax=Tabrizicola sp. TaxID=2005166 RepID=UPI003F31E5A0